MLSKIPPNLSSQTLCTGLLLLKACGRSAAARPLWLRTCDVAYPAQSHNGRKHSRAAPRNMHCIEAQEDLVAVFVDSNLAWRQCRGSPAPGFIRSYTS